MNRLCLVISVLWAAAGIAHSQFSAEGSLTTMADDNINNSSLPIGDRVTDVSFVLGYDWDTETSNTRLSSAGSLDYFSSITDRTYLSHSFELTSSHLFSEEKKSSVNAGAGSSVRLGRGEYTFYDNTQFSLHAGYRQSLAEDIAGKISYAVRIVRFAQLVEMNYVEHDARVQCTALLPTHTTLILEADIGAKVYSAPADGGAAWTGMQGRRVRHTITTSTAGAVQGIGLVRIGQRLAEGTGLSFTATYQVNVQNEPRYLSSEYGVIAGDELFDDHYGYEGVHATLMVTQFLPADVRFQVSGSIQQRGYPSRPAYDLNGILRAAHRDDTQRTIAVLAEKPFESPGIILGLSYDRTDNNSNDLFSTYTKSVYSLRVSYAY